jgi:hypothetical protein
MDKSKSKSIFKERSSTDLESTFLDTMSRNKYLSTFRDSKVSLLAEKTPLSPEILMLKKVQRTFYDEKSRSPTNENSFSIQSSRTFMNQTKNSQSRVRIH